MLRLAQGSIQYNYDQLFQSGQEPICQFRKVGLLLYMPVLNPKLDLSHPSQEAIKEGILITKDVTLLKQGFDDCRFYLKLQAVTIKILLVSITVTDMNLFNLLKR